MTRLDKHDVLQTSSLLSGLYQRVGMPLPSSKAGLALLPSPEEMARFDEEFLGTKQETDSLSYSE